MAKRNTRKIRQEKLGRATYEPPSLQIRLAGKALARSCGARSDLAQAAVDVDFHAGDVGSVVGCEEGHGASDFFGCANALHRNVRHKILHHGVSGFLGQTEASE